VRSHHRSALIIINPYYHSCGFVTDIYLTIRIYEDRANSMHATGEETDFPPTLVHVGPSLTNQWFFVRKY